MAARQTQARQGVPERDAWARRDREPTRAYAAFRAFRDLGPQRQLDAVEGFARRTVGYWSTTWDWLARAAAWDDAQAMIEDAERLDALRAMHRTHQVAARAALSIALTALRQIDPATISASEIARLIDLGVRVERLTLTQSLAELTGQGPAAVDDPWDRIAAELSGDGLPGA